jgi:hypothetical protein
MNAEKEAKKLISKIKKELEWIEKTIQFSLYRDIKLCSTCLLMKKLNINESFLTVSKDVYIAVITYKKHININPSLKHLLEVKRNRKIIGTTLSPKCI